MRLLALVAVVTLFALLVRDLAQGPARVARAIAAGQQPFLPDIRLAVMWPSIATWPAALVPSVRSGRFALRELRGRAAVINFWASWCDPCRREAPALAASARATRGRVVFLAVDVQDATSDARGFLRRHRVPYVSAHSDDSALLRTFGLAGLPETFYVDRRGRIVGVTRGQVSAPELQRRIAALAAG